MKEVFAYYPYSYFILIRDNNGFVWDSIQGEYTRADHAGLSLLAGSNIYLLINYEE